MRLTVFLSALLIHALPGALIVEDPLPITHQVRVQPIQVSDNNGNNTAVFMGSGSSEAYIKGQIDRVWRQVGIEVIWEDLAFYSDSFTNKGNGNYTNNSRPTADLYTITSDSDAPLSASATTINIFFVNISAGHRALGTNSSAGLAKIDANGSTVYVGSNLVTATNWIGGPDVGKDSAAAVIAHEIGHCLGLYHETGLPDNLMYSGSQDEDPERLTTPQRSTVLTNNPGTDGFDFLQANVVEPPVEPETNFGVWALAHELTEGADGDDDGDNMTNGFEFYFGFDPKSASSLPPPTQTIQGLKWSLSPVQLAMDDGFSWFAESSTDLTTWLPAGTVGSKSQRLFDISDFSKVQFVLEPNQLGVFLRFGVIPPAELAGASASAMFAEEPENHTCSSNCCGAVTLVPLEP